MSVLRGLVLVALLMGNIAAAQRIAQRASRRQAARILGHPLDSYWKWLVSADPTGADE